MELTSSTQVAFQLWPQQFESLAQMAVTQGSQPETSATPVTHELWLQLPVAGKVMSAALGLPLSTTGAVVVKPSARQPAHSESDRTQTTDERADMNPPPDRVDPHRVSDGGVTDPSEKECLQSFADELHGRSHAANEHLHHFPRHIGG